MRKFMNGNDKNNGQQPSQKKHWRRKQFGNRHILVKLLLDLNYYNIYDSIKPSLKIINYFFKNMAICQKCGRGPKIAISRSHSHVATKHWQMPNIQVKRVEGKKQHLCTKCIKSLSK
ncbi:MAG: bL28 family ribosomal protein [Patescibacteria group bacterium]